MIYIYTYNILYIDLSSDIILDSKMCSDTYTVYSITTSRLYLYIRNYVDNFTIYHYKYNRSIVYIVYSYIFISIRYYWYTRYYIHISVGHPHQPFLSDRWARFWGKSRSSGPHMMVGQEFVCEDIEVHRSLHYLREEQDAPRRRFSFFFRIRKETTGRIPSMLMMWAG